jgi:hypothetical protein
MTAPQRQTAVQRLRRLPDVFDIRDVELATGWDRKTAANYCWRWKGDGLIQAAGPQVGVYYNLIVDTDSPTTRRQAAVEKALHSSLMVVVGAAALNAHEFTSQQPRGGMEIAVPVRRGATYLPALDGMTLLPRYQTWFSALWETSGPMVEGFPTASGIAALADALLAANRGRPNMWIPAPDDIKPLAEEQVDELDDMLSALGAVPRERADILATFTADAKPAGTTFEW